MTVEVQGFVAPGFEPVRDAFAANFEREDGFREIGASFAAYRGAEPIADLYAGHSDAARTRPWMRGSLVNIWSATKGVTGLAVAVLVERGLIAYDAPVARYWPEYAQNGKGETTVSQVLSHQAGLPGFAEPTTVEDFYDWETVTSRLARQAPMWTPGTKNSYHAQTVGFLAGEIVRRVAGMSLGQFLATEVAGPLQADVFIGVPVAEDGRVAALVPCPTQGPVDASRMTPEGAAAAINPEVPAVAANQRAWRAAEIPATNGHASAQGLARLYAMVANGGAFDGVTLLSPKTIAALSTVQTERVDLLTGMAMNWRNGVYSSEMFGPNPKVFGHSGWGGSFGCADVENRVSMGYVMNQMGDRALGWDPRATALSNALYACL